MSEDDIPAQPPASPPPEDETVTRPVSPPGAEETLATPPTPSFDGPELPTKVGDVTVGQRLGAGGMGVVHLGRDRMLSRDVAVKFLLNAVTDQHDPRFEEFLSGARNAAKVRHSNLVTLHAASLVNDIPCLLMEYIDGPDLKQVLRHHQRLRPALVLRIMQDTAGAVAELHRHDTIHRDIKPSNILFDQQGHLYVTDFGLACSRVQAGGGEGPQRVAGTPTYMSPEMFEGRVSTRSDVYALGMMMFELLTGEPAFRGDPAALRQQHEQAEIPLHKLEAVKAPAELIEVIQRAMNKREVFRFKSASEFERACSVPGLAPASDAELRKLVQLRDDHRTDGEAGTDTEDSGSSSSSYFETLSEIASTKSSSRPAARSRPAQQHPLINENDLISASVPCSGCGYSLIGIAHMDPCPHCRQPIEQTLEDRELSRANTQWLSRMLGGVGWLRGIVIISAGLFLLLAFADLLLSFLLNADEFNLWHRAQSIGIWAWQGVAAIVAWRAAHSLTAREPECELTPFAAQMRGLSVGALVMTLMLVVLALIMGGLGHFKMARIPAMLSMLALLAAFGMLVWHLSHLAWRIPSRSLASSLSAAAMLALFTAGIAWAAAFLTQVSQESPSHRMASVTLILVSGMLVATIWWLAGLLRELQSVLNRLAASERQPSG